MDHEVTVELKNDISIKGTLKSVDQYLNIKLDDIQVIEELKYPHLVSRKSYNSCRKNGGNETILRQRRGLISKYTVVGQECLHSRKRRALCSFTWGCGRYGTFGGCY